MLCFTQLGYRDVTVTEWDKVERQGSTRLSNAVINLLLFFFGGRPSSNKLCESDADPQAASWLARFAALPRLNM